MAVAVKNTPGVATSSPFDRPAVVSLLGVLYVLGCLGIVFKLLPKLWWPAWDGLGLEAYQFVGGSLLGLLMLAAGVALAVLGGRMLGQPAPSVKAGIFVGFVGVVLVLLLTRWASVWVEHWVYDNNWLGAEGPRYGPFIIAAIGVALLVGLVIGFIQPQVQKLLLQFEEGGWFSATAYKSSQGQKVRRGTIFGILMLAGAGIYTLISQGTLRRGPADWAMNLPFTGKVAVEKLGDVRQPWVEDAVKGGKAEVQVKRPGATDLQPKSVVTEKVFREKFKAVLENAKLSEKEKEALTKETDTDLLALLLTTNQVIKAEITRGLGRVEVLRAGETPLEVGKVVPQKRYREEVDGRLAKWSDNVRKEVREVLNKANQEDGLVGLVATINGQILDEVERLVGQVKVTAPGITTLQVNAFVGQDEYRAQLRRALSKAKVGADKKAQATAAKLEKAVGDPSLEALVKEVNAAVAAAVTEIGDGKLLPAAEAAKVKERIKDWTAKQKDAEDGGVTLAAIVADVRKAVEAKNAELSWLLGLPLATVTHPPVFVNPKDVQALRTAAKNATESPAAIAALVEEVKRLEKERLAKAGQGKADKGKASVLRPVFDLPIVLVKDEPVLRSQKDIREIWETEEKMSKTDTDITPLVEKYTQFVIAAKKGSALSGAFDLPTGLVVLDRYTLRDINRNADENVNVKIDQAYASDFKPKDIVKRSTFDEEVAKYADKPGETPPTRVPLVPASGTTTFQPLTLLPSVQFTLPFLLLLGSLWVAWRIVNIPTFADFLIATEAELNKVSWTTQRRLMQDTVVVLATVVLLAVYLFAMDQGWRVLLSWKPVGVLVIPDEKQETKDEQKKW